MMLSTTYTVDSLDDVQQLDGKITLREAIGAANGDVAVFDAPAGSGHDLIQFDPAILPGTITLDGNQLVIGDDLTIIGPGPLQLTIDADDSSRHFEINPGVTVDMSGLRLVNGNGGEGVSGGSIYNDGTLELTDCVLENNRAGLHGGAIYSTSNGPSLTIDNCDFTTNNAVDNGGAVFSQTPATVSRSNFTGNVAAVGGGISTQRSLSVDFGHFEGNRADSGGGICASGSSLVQVVNVTDTTFLLNQVTNDGGALFLNPAVEAVITRCAFDRNSCDDRGGAVHLYAGSVTVDDSDFLDNTAGNHGGGIYQRAGSLTVNEGDFERNSATNVAGAIHAATRLEVAHSRFLGNWTNAQQGGAIYSHAVLTVEHTAFESNAAASHGGAIYHFEEDAWIGNSSFVGNTAGLDGGAANLHSDSTVLDSTFDSNSAGRNGGAVYTINDDYRLVLAGGSMTNNTATNNGGAILNHFRTIEVTGVVIADNHAGIDGGGIFHASGHLSLQDSLLARNTAADDAGGIYGNDWITLDVINSTLSGNTAEDHGGGMFFENQTGNVHILNSTIAENRANVDDLGGGAGGGIRTASPTILLENTIVAGNYVGTAVTPYDIEGTIDPWSQYNLIGDAATAGGLIDGFDNNIVGHDPLLGPLQDNGGPSHTHALTAGSPAIDSGDNALALRPDGSLILYDQRGYGFDRVVGLWVDRGAYEVQQPGGEIHGRKWYDLDRDGLPDEAWGLSIVENGGFEEGSLGTGNWTDLFAGYGNLDGWQVLRFVQCINDVYSDPAEGRRFMDMNGSDVGAIAQMLVTEPGRRYRVTFQMAGLATGNLGLKTLRVSAAGESEDFTFDTTGHSARDMGWEAKTWEFVAQDTSTMLKFESLGPHNWAGPAIDNVVVQPYGRDDVQIYLDLDDNGQFDAGEPVTLLRDDDPNTPAVDETGTYRFIGLPPGDYVVRELIPEGWEQVEPVPPDGYDVTIVAEEVHTGLDFGNRYAGAIRGTKFVDLNGNGIRDRNPFPGDSPLVVMVIDVSATTGRNVGFTVGNVNGDANANEVLDAELYTMLALRQELIDLGWGASAQVSVVVFGAEGVQLDMDPATAGVQLLTTPTADADGDGTSDLEQVLRSVRKGHPGTGTQRTDYEQGLSIEFFQAFYPVGGTLGPASVFFCSDGLPNNLWSYDDEVEEIEMYGYEMVAYGFGPLCDLNPLRRIDPFAVKLASTADVAQHVAATSLYGDNNGDGRWLEPGLAGVTIYLDDDHNGQLDWTDLDSDGEWDPGEGERWTLSRADDTATTDVDETGWYAFDDLPIGTYAVREIVPAGYVQTAPLNPDYHQVDLRTGPIAEGRDFGNRPMPGCIEGLKGLDLDDDGDFDGDDVGQGGVTIYLDLNESGDWEEGEPLTVTAADGTFRFDDVSPGTYTVRELVPPGFEQILPGGGGGITIEVTAGGTAGGLLFVNQDVRGCLIGWKWIDIDGDEWWDPDEPGLAGVRVYLDLNDNGRWNSGEPYAFTQADDPTTPEVDETGRWEIVEVVPGEYIIREVSPEGYDPGYPGPGGHPVLVEPRGVIDTGLLFGNLPLLPCVGGWKYEDYNENGRRDPNRLQGDVLVMVVDVSDSTRNLVGDFDGDGQDDTVLDLELASLIAVNQEIIDRGLDTAIDVAIVVFGDQGFQIDMDPTTPATPAVLLSTSPSADVDGDGTPDVEQVLRSIDRDDYGSAIRTDYEAALQTVAQTIQDLGVARSSMLFVSDGEPNDPDNYVEEVADLRDMGVTLSAFGAGGDATLYTLQIIDPRAVRFTNPAELVRRARHRRAAATGGGSSRAWPVWSSTSTPTTTAASTGPTSTATARGTRAKANGGR